MKFSCFGSLKNLRRPLQVLFVGCLAFSVGLSARAQEGEARPQEKKPEARNINRAVLRKERELKRLVESMRELYEDMERNKYSATDPRKCAKIAKKLEHLSTEEIPQITVGLKSGGVRGVERGARKSEQAADVLREVVNSMRKDVAGAVAERALGTALEKQLAAYTKTNGIRVLDADYAGIVVKRLPQRTQAHLVQAKNLQRDALAELEHALARLKERAGTMQGSEPEAAAEMEAAVAEMAGKGVKRKSENAVRYIAENHLRAAESLQLEIIKALKKARKRLTAKRDGLGDSRAAALRKTTGILREALAAQKKAIRTAEEINPADDGFVTGLKKQNAVSKLLREALEGAAAAVDEINLALTKSESAKKNFLFHKLPPARKDQREALAAIEAALTAAAAAEKRAAEVGKKVEQLLDKLDAVRRAAEEQRELLSETEKVKPEDAASLARDEARLAAKTENMAKQDEPGEQGDQQPQEQGEPGEQGDQQPKEQGEPGEQGDQQPKEQGEPGEKDSQGDKSLQEAAEQMKKATRDLADGKPQNASQQEKKALDALQKAAQNLLNELAQTDPASAQKALGEMTDQLAETQQDLNRKTEAAGEKGELAAQADRQKQNAEKAAEAAKMPGQENAAQKALEEASENMENAAKALEQGDKNAAQKAQQAASKALQKAKKAQKSSMEQAQREQDKEDQQKQTESDNEPSEGEGSSTGERSDKKATGEIQFGDLEEIPKDMDWKVALPKKDRANIEMARKEPLPPKYAKRLQLYYQDLASPEKK